MRILITTVTAGGGHMAAASALQETWQELRPDDVVEKVDILKFCSPLERKMHSKGYLALAGHAPELWGMVFRATDDPAVARRLSRLKRALPSISRVRFSRYLSSFAPDAVLCTHYLPLETLGIMRTAKPEGGAGGRESGVPFRSGKPLVASIVTDFEAHVLWMDPCVDLYCVAADQTRTRLVARGARAQDVIATGIPVSRKFGVKVNAAAVRKRLGLRDDLPVLLALSGGFGMGPVAEIVAHLDKAEESFQIVVVTGRNDTLRRKLAAQTRIHPTDVLGFAPNMHELMAVSNLILSKPGGLTTSEALALGKPMLIIDPIPGQEAANSDFLLEHGAGAKVNRPEDLPFRVGELLGSKKLEGMARAAGELGQPDAAERICKEIARRSNEQ